MNEKIVRRNNKEIIIIEWDKSGNEEERNRFWKNLFDHDVTLIRKNNILDFDFTTMI